MLATAHSKLRQQNHIVFNDKYNIKCKDLKIKQHSDLYSYDHTINYVRTRIFPSTINPYNMSNVYFHCNEMC